MIDSQANSAPPDEPRCPWCPYTASLKQVIAHMESRHHQRWCELILHPPLAEGVY
jgi:hypothetical protein